MLGERQLQARLASGMQHAACSPCGHQEGVTPGGRLRRGKRKGCGGAGTGAPAAALGPGSAQHSGRLSTGRAAPISILFIRHGWMDG